MLLNYQPTNRDTLHVLLTFPALLHPKPILPLCWTYTDNCNLRQDRQSNPAQPPFYRPLQIVRQVRGFDRQAVCALALCVHQVLRPIALQHQHLWLLPFSARPLLTLAVSCALPCARSCLRSTTEALKRSADSAQCQRRTGMTQCPATPPCGSSSSALKPHSRAHHTSPC